MGHEAGKGRFASSGGNGNIKIISVRPVDKNDDEKSAKKQASGVSHKKRRCPTKRKAGAISLDRVKHELAKEAQKENPSDDGDSQKILPSASDAKLKADKDKELQKKRQHVQIWLGGADQTTLVVPPNKRRQTQEGSFANGCGSW